MRKKRKLEIYTQNSIKFYNLSKQIADIFEKHIDKFDEKEYQDLTIDLLAIADTIEVIGRDYSEMYIKLAKKCKNPLTNIEK